MDPNFRAGLTAAEEQTTPPEKPAVEEPKEAPGDFTDDSPAETPAETGDDGQTIQGAPENAVEAADKALGKKPAEKPEPKLWRGKFKEKNEKGEEIEEEVELAEEEVAKLIGRRRSLDRAAFGWSEEAKRLDREMKARDEKLAQDPWTVLREKGIDPMQAALGFLKQQVDFHNLPPEQKAQIQLAQEREALATERQTLADQKAASEHEVLKKSYQERIVKELPAAMDKRGLVKHPLVMSLLNDIGTAHMMATRSEFPDLEYAAEETEAVLQEAAAAWLGNLAEKNPAALIKALPPAVLKAVQAQALASAAKGPTRPAVIGTPSSAPRVAAKPRGETKPTYKSPQEWRQSLIANAKR